MIAVDILEVPLSTNNNWYFLVIQDYFTKWAEAIPIQDQRAACIARQLTKLFSTYGQPEILHSDQGRNFESTLLAQTLEAFCVQKSRTTAYHPQGDGMVEWFNRSFLQLLRAYVDKENDWKQYLPLVLYAYHTSVHTSTGCSPFLLTFGHNPCTSYLGSQAAYNSSVYQDHICDKIAELQDFVDTNLVQAASNQKVAYYSKTCVRKFTEGDPVWLSIPTAGKLDPRWEGNWTIKSIKSPVTMEISDGNRTRVVHVNRLQHCLQLRPVTTRNSETDPPKPDCQVDHFFLPTQPPHCHTHCGLELHLNGTD